MKIKLHLIPEEGSRLEGDESPSIMDFQDPLYQFEQPIHYALEVTLLARQTLVVQGTLSTTVRARCVRTLEWFDLPLAVKDFQYHRSHPHGDEVDLTPEIREDILLALPSNPALPQAPPVEVREPVRLRVRNEAWRKLDQLKIT